MEGFVAKHVHDYQNGKISRRWLIEILTLAATTAYAGKSASAAEPSGLDAALVKPRLLHLPGLSQGGPTGTRRSSTLTRSAPPHATWRCRSAKRAKGLTASAPTMLPLTHIICRTRPLDSPAGSGPPRRKASAVIDHIAFTVADFDRERAKAQLTAPGVKNVRGRRPIQRVCERPVRL